MVVGHLLKRYIFIFFDHFILGYLSFNITLFISSIFQVQFPINMKFLQTFFFHFVISLPLSCLLDYENYLHMCV